MAEEYIEGAEAVNRKLEELNEAYKAKRESTKTAKSAETKTETTSTSNKESSSQVVERNQLKVGDKVIVLDSNGVAKDSFRDSTGKQIAGTVTYVQGDDVLVNTKDGDLLLSDDYLKVSGTTIIRQTTDASMQEK